MAFYVLGNVPGIRHRNTLLLIASLFFSHASDFFFARRWITVFAAQEKRPRAKGAAMINPKLIGAKRFADSFVIRSAKNKHGPSMATKKTTQNSQPASSNSFLMARTAARKDNGASSASATARKERGVAGVKDFVLRECARLSSKPVSQAAPTQRAREPNYGRRPMGIYVCHSRHTTPSLGFFGTDHAKTSAAQVRLVDRDRSAVFRRWTFWGHGKAQARTP